MRKHYVPTQKEESRYFHDYLYGEKANTPELAKEARKIALLLEKPKMGEMGAAELLLKLGSWLNSHAPK